MQAQLIGRLGPTAGKILQPLINAYPEEIDKDVLGHTAGYTNVRSKGFRNALSRLRTMGFVDYPSQGTVVATDVLFLR